MFLPVLHDGYEKLHIPIAPANWLGDLAAFHGAAKWVESHLVVLIVII